RYPHHEPPSRPRATSILISLPHGSGLPDTAGQSATELRLAFGSSREQHSRRQRWQRTVRLYSASATCPSIAFQCRQTDRSAVASRRSSHEAPEMQRSEVIATSLPLLKGRAVASRRRRGASPLLGPPRFQQTEG